MIKQGPVLSAQPTAQHTAGTQHECQWRMRVRMGGNKQAAGWSLHKALVLVESWLGFIVLRALTFIENINSFIKHIWSASLVPSTM